MAGNNTEGTNKDVQKVPIGQGNVVKGEASVPVSVSTSIPIGEYTITAEYIQNEEYAGSRTNGKLIVGYGTTVHCPRIYVWDKYKTNGELIAHIYQGRNPVSIGDGTFRIDGEIIDSQTPTSVQLGVAKKIWNMSDLDSSGTGIHKYQYRYNGNKATFMNPSISNNGDIYILDSKSDFLCDPNVKKYTVLEMPPLVGKPGETIDFRIRVLFQEYGFFVNSDDVPNSMTGEVKFGLRSEPESEWTTVTLTNNGIANCTYTIPDTLDEGCYDLFSAFKPYWDKSDENRKYSKSYGATTLFVTNSELGEIRPVLSGLTRNISFNSSEKSASFSIQIIAPTDKYNNIIPTRLEGYAQLKIDNTLIDLIGSSDDHKLNATPVSSSGKCTFIFNVDGKNINWSKPGNDHKIEIIYYPNEGNPYSFIPTINFIVRKQTSLEIENTFNDEKLVYLSATDDTTDIKVRVNNEDAETEADNFINQGVVLVNYTQED